MSDKITTLHLKNDPSTNVYPNVKIENIPLDMTITRDGENLVKTKTIYEFTHLNFLSLDGGTMNGIITINDISIPEKTILGDGVEVIDVSSPANATTHYGSGYIRQDDDEDTSVKYEYNFPKKSGTFALKEDLPVVTKFGTISTSLDIAETYYNHWSISNGILKINYSFRMTPAGANFGTFTLYDSNNNLLSPTRLHIFNVGMSRNGAIVNVRFSNAGTYPNFVSAFTIFGATANTDSVIDINISIPLESF